MTLFIILNISYCMRTTINIPDELANELYSLSNAETKTSAVNAALVEWIKQKKKQKLLALRGQIDILDNIEELRRIEIEEMKHEV
jgi:hypothetical protein